MSRNTAKSARPARRRQRVKRAYDMALRAANAAATRSDVIAAAHDLLERDQGALALDEVASVAGVTRPTLYNHFGSRSALLAAVFEDQGRLIDYDRVRAAQKLPDVREALTNTLRELGRAWSVRRKALRRTLALAVIDPEVEQLVVRYERYRRSDMAALAQRLHSAELLPRSLTLDDATAILGALTSFQFYDVLSLLDAPNVATRHLTQIVSGALGVTPFPSLSTKKA